MSDLFEKLIKIFVGEFVEAVIFMMLLVVANALPNDEISKQITSLIITCWVLFGISTPLVIFFEIEKVVFSIIKGLK